jgi:tripartite motif-containing protein 2/3
VTVLPLTGVQGLQNDFRIQQIRDILGTRPQSPTADAGGAPEVKTCDVCRSNQKVETAQVHCIQCFMFLCAACQTKHNANTIFAGHHLLSVSDQSFAESLFCKSHKEQAVRYFCCVCAEMLCTVCILDHDPTHATQPFDRALVERYRQELKAHQKAVVSKLTDINSRAKYFEAVKQSQQRALYKAQSAVRDRSEELVRQVRGEEKRLLEMLQEHMEGTLRLHGAESVSDAQFKKSTLESLYTDITRTLNGSPQLCLMSYDDINARVLSLSDTPLPAVDHKCASSTFLRFFPSTDVYTLGSLRESTLSDEDTGEDDLVLSSSPPHTSCPSLSTQLVPRRVTSILNALSPTRTKIDLKKSKLKCYGDAGPKSPSTISADSLISSTEDVIPLMRSSSPLHTTPSSPLSLSPSISSPLSSSAPQSPLRPVSPAISIPSPITSSSYDAENAASSSFKYHPKMLFKLDQVGGWPGKVTSPTGVDFLPDGNLIVAECENRLQVFDHAGHSIRIIGWGKIRPCGVVVSREGHISITDKKDSCIKVYQMDGDCLKSWGTGQLSSPSGIAITSNNHYIVTDVNRHSVSIYSAEGNILSQFGQWGSDDYQFNNPSHVTVDQHDNILVSDAGNACIKIYDKAGLFVRRIALGNSKHGQLRKPQGIAVDNHGHVLVSDRDNHRVSMLTYDGHFVCHLLNKNDGIRFPSDISLDASTSNLAIVETHTGFLTKDPHHAVKLYNLNG